MDIKERVLIWNGQMGHISDVKFIANEPDPIEEPKGMDAVNNRHARRARESRARKSKR